MASPIFFPFYMKKYLVQTRPKQKSWKDYDSFRHLEDAKAAAQKLLRQNPELEARIMNKVTNQEIKRYEGGQRGLSGK